MVLRESERGLLANETRRGRSSCSCLKERKEGNEGGWTRSSSALAMIDCSRGDDNVLHRAIGDDGYLYGPDASSATERGEDDRSNEERRVSSGMLRGLCRELIRKREVEASASSGAERLPEALGSMVDSNAAT